MSGPGWMHALGIVVTSLMGVGFPAAQAPDSTLLYAYQLTGRSATPPNLGPSLADLSLQGTWSASSDFGVTFDGDTAGRGSVGSARPTTGLTLDVAAGEALGAAIRFRYQSPADGACFEDSPNLTQIGRFGAGLSQIKLQLSNCGVSSSAAYVQCRVAGASSSTSDLPVTSSQPLVSGASYTARCLKAPDPGSGRTPIVLTVNRLDGPAALTNDRFDIHRPGALSSAAYLSVGNKYPLPGGSANTDQFHGEIAAVAFCKAGTVGGAMKCLEGHVPLTAPAAGPGPVSPR